MAASNDQEEIIELVNRTASFLEGQVRARMQPDWVFCPDIHLGWLKCQSSVWRWDAAWAACMHGWQVLDRHCDCPCTV